MKRKIVAVLSTSALLALGASITSMAATAGWVSSGTDWYYEKSNGERVENDWKKSGDFWYWLGEDGRMVKDSFVDDDGDFYYVDANGVMATNTWKYLETEYTDGDMAWYYFGPNGKAIRKTGEKAKLYQIGTVKYIFDENGLMQYGWVNEAGEMADPDDTEAWKDAMYYCGEDDSTGWVRTGWLKADVENADDADYQGYYWFYFNPSSGKKVVDNDGRQIDGKRYGFDEHGVMLYEFANTGVSTPSNAVDGYKYYQDIDNGANKRSGWFQAIPDEDINPEGYSDGDYKWFYANSNGSLKVSQLASISGKKYAFNEYGERLSGLRGLELDSNNNIISYTDAAESMSDIYAIEGDSKYDMYYFGDENDGVMRKKSQTIRLDDETLHYEFLSSGAGKDGIVSGSIYTKGRRVEADKEYGYEMFDINGNETVDIGSGYLVNTSGKIQKNKTNIKDKNDTYYCTDAEGLVTYKGYEKK